MKKKFLTKIQKQRLEKKIKKFLFFYFFPAFIFLISLVFLLNSNFMSVKKVDIVIDGQVKFLDKQKIENDIQDILSEKYFYSISKNNFILIPRGEIEKKLKEKYSEIEKIDISWGNFLENIKIDLWEEDAEFVYCKNKKSEVCNYVNGNGKIFFEVGNWDEKKLVLLANKDLEKGNLFFDSLEEKEKIKNLLNFLKKEKLEIKYFLKHNEYSYRLITEKDEKIILNSDFDFYKTTKILRKIFKNEDLKINNNRFIKEIDYINLSVKSRVYYCLVGEECSGSYK